MKAKAIIFASMLLAGCQGVNHHANEPEQYAQSLSSVSRSEAGQPSRDARATSARWLNDSSSDIAQKDLWGFISDDLKMKVPDNSRIREQKINF